MQYRKKAVVIDAIQWNGSNLDQCKSFLGNSFLGQRAERHPGGANVIMIKTLEGQHIASLNDFLIRGVKGEHYPCKPDIFAATYDAVSDGEYGDAYQGAREDAEIWKRRALEAEAKLRATGSDDRSLSDLPSIPS